MGSRSSNSSSAGGGTSIAGLLGIAFIVLKLTHVVAWSWWWVTAPFWGGLALAAVIAVIGLIVIGTIGAGRSAKARR